MRRVEGKISICKCGGKGHRGLGFLGLKLAVFVKVPVASTGSVNFNL
jgi:hypothetical protein